MVWTGHFGIASLLLSRQPLLLQLDLSLLFTQCRVKGAISKRIGVWRVEGYLGCMSYSNEP